MKFVDISLTEEPVNVNDFKYFSNSDFPLTFIGMPIYHQYDNLRIQFSEKYKPENYFYVQSQPLIQTKFFKGIPFKLSSKFNDLIEDIEYASGLNYENTNAKFDLILNKFRLNNKNCFSFLDKGIYPINGEHIDELSGGKLKIKNLYENAFKNTDKCFQCFGSLNIFILTSNYLSDEIYENLFQPTEVTYPV